ncbi:Rhodanese-related sulfurtransferase [Cribrihabitans marinus]|uniref:Rhodanese-related sulfurtransferase n=1 Tax=Cribrihabitans marinus TaxID=1227549 RepID=A0A1H7AZW6_9RHOB|nr:rhodanese-like domain-containing protein [Cribrihabitans marinus]GGH32797.1 hypothetical protein GCM10010973_24500 [Cribrihabitans marinus]SEJ70486.1 Rhodanese-related sulfurtransferase [Cribrihabitans marinus]
MERKLNGMVPRMTRRWLLLAGIAALGAWGIRQYRLIPPDFPGGTLTAGEAFEAAQSGRIVLVDIRTPQEWRRTGIARGAHPIDMRREDFRAALDDLTAENPSRPVALICARGVRSARLGNALAEAGYDNILDVPEGMLGSRAGPGWLASDLPVTAYSGGAG